MLIKFTPHYIINNNIANALLKIESVNERVKALPVTATVLASLRETARLYTTHYSTMIEGNRLSMNEITHVLKYDGHFPGREREEDEVKGYYAAIAMIEQHAARGDIITEKTIQMLHAYVMSGGRTKIKSTPYRDGQNVIRDVTSGGLIYMPPEARDVPELMAAMVGWICDNNIPIPIMAAIAHYQFATIHPYYDGNGRCARLLTNLILHLGGYGLRGIYSLEEYYARNLNAYYEAITIGPSHNYYMGRAESDITQWVEYFITGMADAFEKVLNKMDMESWKRDYSDDLRFLDAKQRKMLELFSSYAHITSAQVGELFGFKGRFSAMTCQKWVDAGFLDVVDPSNKARKYKLAQKYEHLIGK